LINLVKLLIKQKSSVFSFSLWLVTAMMSSAFILGLIYMLGLPEISELGESKLKVHLIMYEKNKLC